MSGAFELDAREEDRLVDIIDCKDGVLTELGNLENCKVAVPQFDSGTQMEVFNLVKFLDFQLLTLDHFTQSASSFIVQLDDINFIHRLNRGRIVF